MTYGWRLFLGFVLLVTLGTAGCFVGYHVGISIKPNWGPGVAGLMLAGGIAGFTVSEYISDKLLFA